MSESDQEPFNADDLGINIGDLEDNDFCRGYGYNTNLNEEYENFESAIPNDIINDDKAPEMPQEFYHNLDSFLNRAAPKLNESSSNKKKVKTTKQVGSQGPPMFPSLAPRVNSKVMNISELPIPPAVEKQLKSKKKSSDKEKPVMKKNIDSNLLNEAFEYTDRLLREAVVEEAQQHKGKVANGDFEDKYHISSSQQPRGAVGGGTAIPRSAPLQESAYGTSHKQRGNKTDTTSNISVIRRLKSNNASAKQKTGLSGRDASGGFDTTADAEQDSRKNAVDFDELVANFQSGATLQRLRRELEQSQQSMAHSESKVKNLSRDFFKHS